MRKASHRILHTMLYYTNKINRGNSFKAVLQNSFNDNKKKSSTILGTNYRTAPKPCELDWLFLALVRAWGSREL